MGMFLKQSTAIDVSIGPFLDETDGKTQETALTITQPDIRLKKNGGAWAQKNAAQTLSHEEAGWYEIALDTTDTNTVGNLLVAIHESGALPVWREFQVLPANVYDSLIGGTDALQVHANEITAGLITAAAIATGAIDADALAADTITAAKIATGAISAAKFAAGAIDAAAIADGAIDAATLAAGTITAAKFAAGAIDAAAIADGAIDAGAFAADAITATKLAADVTTELQSGLATAAALATVQADTDDIQTRLPAALVGGRMDASVGAAAANTITASALAADAVTEIQSGLALSTQVDALEGGLVTALADLDDIQTRLPAALVSGRIDASVGAMAANTMTASALATDTVDEIVAAIFKLDIDTVEATAAVHSLCSAVLKLVSRFKATTGVTYRTDGTTPHMTQTPVTDSITPISEFGVGT